MKRKPKQKPKPKQFVWYVQDKYHRVVGSNVVIRRRGIIWFNSEASRAFGLPDWSRVLLGWDKSERCIAVKPVTECIPGSRKIKCPNGHDACISCRPFFQFTPGLVEPEHNYRCPRAEIDQASGMILIWLGENYPNAEPAPTSQK